MTQKKKKPGTARRVAETTLDVAVGGTALAADKAIETFEKVADRAEEAIQRGRKQMKGARQRAESAAGRAKREARKAAGERDTRPYEERTRDELYDLATERDIEGRSSMSKAELIAALRIEN